VPKSSHPHPILRGELKTRGPASHRVHRDKSRYRLSYRDAAILPTALKPGCHTVHSEDLNHGQTYAGVRVINPFVSVWRCRSR
jgi:predicted nucleic acid-binding protein